MMTAGAWQNDKTGKQIACEMHTCLLQWHESQKRSEGEGEYYEDGRGGAERGQDGGAGKQKNAVEVKGEGGQRRYITEGDVE